MSTDLDTLPVDAPEVVPGPTLTTRSAIVTTAREGADRAIAEAANIIIFVGGMNVLVAAVVWTFDLRALDGFLQGGEPAIRNGIYGLVVLLLGLWARRRSFIGLVLGVFLLWGIVVRNRAMLGPIAYVPVLLFGFPIWHSLETQMAIRWPSRDR